MYGIIKSQWRRNGARFNWNITIPANTTAQVAVPARDIDVVREGEHVITPQNPHIHFVKMEGGYAVFSVMSGEYHFTSVIGKR
jgi:alpha-L-rhamnosidase